MQQKDGESIFPVGVIVSEQVDGAARVRDIVRCAELIAAEYNSRGGVEIDGDLHRVELRVVDYGDDSMQAVRLANQLIHDHGVRYFIGPDSGRSLSSVVPLYQAAGALFVHSDVSFNAGSMNTLGFAVRPPLEHSLSMLCEFLSEERAVESIAVVAGMQSGALAQKIRVEAFGRECGFSVRSLARYDVHEEVYNHQLSDVMLENWCRRLLVSEPDAVLLCGFLPEVVPMVLESLSLLNYSGEVVMLDMRGPDMLDQGSELWEGVLFLGGALKEEAYSSYYNKLRGDISAHDVQWNVESNIRLYALETILLLVQAGGRVAISDPRYLMDMLEEDSIAMDPFYRNRRSLRILGEGNNSSGWQIEVPVYISEVVDGVPRLVRSASFDSEQK